MSNRVYKYSFSIPPSVNRLWRISGRRMYRSKLYTEWIDQCRKELVDIDPPFIDYPFAIEIIVGRPSQRRMDIDNRSKAVMDMLQHLDIITDDCLAHHITMYWSNEIQNCQVTISKAAV